MHRGEECDVIEATVDEQGIGQGGPSGESWRAVTRWADQLANLIGGHRPGHQVSVFVFDPAVDALRLAAQVSGPGNDAGSVVVGEWLVSVDGSVCGRVLQTGAPVLSPDVSLDPDDRPFPGSDARSELTLPAIVDAWVVAVVNLEATRVSTFSIDDYDRIRGQIETLAPDFPTDVWP